MEQEAKATERSAVDEVLAADLRQMGVELSSFWEGVWAWEGAEDGEVP